jgi:hypothetical protein
LKVVPVNPGIAAWIAGAPPHTTSALLSVTQVNTRLFIVYLLVVRIYR